LVGLKQLNYGLTGHRTLTNPRPHALFARGQSVAFSSSFWRLEHDPLILTYLTGFSRLLARQASRRGPARPQVKHNAFSGREKSAFGGPNQPIAVVTQLDRCTRIALRCVPGRVG
jgi:hypothetical protein